MPDSEEGMVILQAYCEKCHTTWHPYGGDQFLLPKKGHLICPKCGDEFDHTWYDLETKRLLERKKLGLIQSIDSNQLDALTKKLELLEARLETVSKQSELSDAKVDQVKAWAKGREVDFKAIEEIAKELKEDEQVREDNK